MGNLSASEIALILVIGLLLFGEKLPQVGRSLGKALTEFKRGLKGMEEDFERASRNADLELDEEERQKRNGPPPEPPPPPPALPAPTDAAHVTPPATAEPRPHEEAASTPQAPQPPAPQPPASPPPAPPA